MKKQTTAPFPEAPAHLSDWSKALWNELGPQRARTPERRILFQTALESLDRAEQARHVVARAS